MRDPDPPRLWRIADFSSLRLVINIEFFLREKSDQDEKVLAREALFEVRQELARGGARGGVVGATLSCVGGLKGIPMLVGYTRCARKSSLLALLCRPLSTLRQPTFFPHRASYVRGTDETFLLEESEICPVMQPTL